MKRLPVGWILLSLLYTLASLPLLTTTYVYPELKQAGVIALIFVCLFPALMLISPGAMRKRGLAMRELREKPHVALLLMTVLLLLILLLWGVYPLPEFSIVTFALWFYLVFILWGWESSPERRKAIGRAFDGNRVANLLIPILTVLVLFGSLELYMRLTSIQPDGFAMTLQFRTWMERYFYPINELGYRGYDPIAPTDDQESILVLGDSYAVGHGLNDIDDVFAYQLADMLGEDYVVNLHGHLGISPNVEEWLEPYPVQPDILILSHFVNDIIHEGFPGQETYLEFFPEGIVRWLSERYFLFSFAYWHGYAGPRMVTSYGNELLSAYDNPELWQAHQARLQEFVDWSQDNDVPLVVLIWGTLNNLEASATVDAQVANFFREHDVTVILMSDYIADLPVAERMINPFDSHPSILVNHIAAEALFETLQSTGLIQLEADN